MSQHKNAQNPLTTLKCVLAWGKRIPSRLGDTLDLHNFATDYNFPPGLIFTQKRNENLLFEFKYIIQTIYSLPESYLACDAKIIRDEIQTANTTEKIADSYGELIKDNLQNLPLATNSRRYYIPIWKDNALQMVTPPCNIGFVLRPLKKLHMTVFTRSADALIGHWNDAIMFRNLQYLISKRLLKYFQTGKQDSNQHKYKLGTLRFNFVSLHLYIKDYERSCAIIADAKEPEFINIPWKSIKFADMIKFRNLTTPAKGTLYLKDISDKEIESISSSFIQDMLKFHRVVHMKKAEDLQEISNRKIAQSASVVFMRKLNKNKVIKNE